MSYPTLPEATTYLHEHIPLSAAMGISVVHLAQECVELIAPLAPNINHRQTAFGGSISSAAVLAAWTYLHFRLRTEVAMPCRVVISRSETVYTAPVETDFHAICLAPTEANWVKFLLAIRRHGKGRIVLVASIFKDENDQNALASFTGTFVAVTQQPDRTV